MEQGWKLQLTTTIIPENIPTQTMEQHLKFTWSLQSSTLIIRMKETTPVLLIRFRNVLVIAFYFRSKNCRKVWNRYVQRLSLGHFSLIRGTFIIYMGKSGDCSWKIKWFAPFRLGSFKNHDCNLRGCNISTLFCLFSWFVAGRSPATSNSDFDLGGYGKHTRTGFKGLRASVCQTFRLFIDSFPRQKS